MSDLVGNPEDRFSHNKAHIQYRQHDMFIPGGYECGIEEFRIIGFYLYHVTSIRPSNSIGASGSLTASLNIDYDRGSSSYYR